VQAGLHVRRHRSPRCRPHAQVRNPAGRISGGDIDSLVVLLRSWQGASLSIFRVSGTSGYVEVAKNQPLRLATDDWRTPIVDWYKQEAALDVPIVWDQSTYVKTNQVDKWEQQAPFGYRCGISLALHMPEGRHFFVGVDRDQALPCDPAEVTRMVAAVQLFTVYAQDAAQRLLLPESPQTPDPARPTPRELECLRWTMEGKTAWELGRILGISEQTAARHVNSATHKLGSVNKHQAVLKALRMKLIW